MSRGGIKINRCDENERGDRVNWLDEFAFKIEATAAGAASADSVANTTAVDAARARDQRSLVDQITSIVSKRPSHSSVESVVQDMQERTGLKEYLRRMSAARDSAVQKSAQVTDGSAVTEGINTLPEGLGLLPQGTQDNIKTFISNLISTHHGNIQIPAVVEEVSRTFRQQGVQPKDVNDQKFEEYINKEIIRIKKMNPAVVEHNLNLGRGVGLDNADLDPSNSDAFDGLTPAKALM